MAKKKISFSSPMVYSTDPFFIREETREEITTLSPEHQPLKIVVDKKHRAGKVVTLITGFAGSAEHVEALSKELKSFCGTGGAVKEGTIIIQGDNRDKIFQWLLKNNYQQVKKT